MIVRYFILGDINVNIKDVLSVTPCSLLQCSLSSYQRSSSFLHCVSRTYMHIARIGSVILAEYILCFAPFSPLFIFTKSYFTSWYYSTFLKTDALTAVSMTITVFCDIKSCRLINPYRSFGGNIYPEDGGKMILLYIVNDLLCYMV
jgi:hypothetical protein